MAATGSGQRRVLSNCHHPPGEPSLPGSSGLCREPLLLTSLQRYGKDLDFPVFFPRAIYAGESLYDATLTDGNRRLRVTLDPGLSGLVERNALRCGSLLRNVSLAPGVCVQEGCGVERGTYGGQRVVSLEVVKEEDEEEEEEEEEGGVALHQLDPDTLPWFGAGPDAGEADPGPLMPLRADRALFLPLWNNADPIGSAWRDTPPSPSQDDSGAESEEMEEVHATATLREVQEAFLSGCHSIRGVVRRTLVVRIMNKSQLMYYGKSDKNCQCPYKAELQVGDVSATVSAVLWNSVCVDWYRSLRPGQMLALSHYRVKESYDSRTSQSHQTNIELSVNSRNPTAQIRILPESLVSPECRPPKPKYSFYSGNELLSCLHGNLCDVIGLVMFAGRSERTRVQGSQGAELLEYRWLGLEDGTSDQPIMVKLFSTSQPETHRKILPLCVLVCTRLKMIRGEGWCYLTNSSYTQTYCTGSGQHSKMPYKKLRPVRQFLQWIQSLDDRQVLSRAVIGGFFCYPPPPISLETFMKNRKGEPGLLSGGELHRELERLQYRETHSYCIQASVSMVTHCRRGEEALSSVWTDRRRTSSTPVRLPPPLSRRLSSPPLSPSTSVQPRGPPRSSASPALSCRLSPSPSPSGSCVPGQGQLQTRRRPAKRKLFSTSDPDPTRKRLPRASLQRHTLDDHDAVQSEGCLWEASMEFLEKTKDEDEDDDDDDDEGSSPFLTAPSSLSTPSSARIVSQRVAMETLPLRYSPAQGEEQAVAMAMQTGTLPSDGRRRGDLESFSTAESYTGHYTLTLRGLSDRGLLDAIFLPTAPPLCLPLSPPLSHPNTWSSILTHGAFSTHTPPPSPADLIATATQLANQRLVCVLEACHLGGNRTELVLTRAYPLRD